MARAILHIGSPKTGTTAIQRALRDNQESLAREGLRYPTFLRGENHFELAVYAAEDQDKRAHFLMNFESADQMREFRATFAETFRTNTAGGDWIFSSEHLSSRVRSEESMHRLVDLMNSFDTTVVYYARRQDAMAMASYSTWVRSGDPRAFDVESHLNLSERYDHRSIITRWDSAFGEANVIVRLYPEGSTSVVSDFRSVISDSDASWTMPPKLNPSLDATETVFVREMNRLLPRWNDGPTRRFMDHSDAIAGSGRGLRLAMSSHDSRRLLARYRESNEWLMTRATNAAEFPGYFDPPDDDDPGTIDVELTNEDLLGFARALWARASATEKRLRRIMESA